MFDVLFYLSFFKGNYTERRNIKIQNKRTNRLTTLSADWLYQQTYGLATQIFPATRVRIPNSDVRFISGVYLRYVRWFS